MLLSMIITQVNKHHKSTTHDDASSDSSHHERKGVQEVL